MPVYIAPRSDGTEVDKAAVAADAKMMIEALEGVPGVRCLSVDSDSQDLFHQEER